MKNIPTQQRIKHQDHQLKHSHQHSQNPSQNTSGFFDITQRKNINVGRFRDILKRKFSMTNRQIDNLAIFCGRWQKFKKICKQMEKNYAKNKQLLLESKNTQSNSIQNNLSNNNAQRFPQQPNVMNPFYLIAQQLQTFITNPNQLSQGHSFHIDFTQFPNLFDSYVDFVRSCWSNFEEQQMKNIEEQKEIWENKFGIKLQSKPPASSDSDEGQSTHEQLPPNLINQSKQKEEIDPLFKKKVPVEDRVYAKKRKCDGSIQYQGCIKEHRMWEWILEEEINDEDNFDVIVVDPPWKNHGFKFKYICMSNKEWMPAIPLIRLQRKGLLFVWTTNNQLEAAQKYIKDNGYQRIETVIWIKLRNDDKINKGIGYYMFHNMELCLVAMKGNPTEMQKKIKLKTVSNVIFAKVREGSQKPDEFYDLVERFVPKGKYIDIFGRIYNQRPGWVTVGNESIYLQPQLVKEFEENQKKKREAKKLEKDNKKILKVERQQVRR